MNVLPTILLLITGAYLVGSIPTAVWVGKLFYGIDIREHGSKNAGASNTFRILGVKAGIPVLLIDIIKGFLAVKLITLTSMYEPDEAAYVNVQLLMGAAALLGHIFPIYAGFRGGKGVATILGVVIALHPAAAFLSLSVFLAMLLTTRYVSLSSMTGGLSFPFWVIVVFKCSVLSLIVFSIVVSILLIATHQKNIGRLIRHEESKANLFKWRKKK